MATESDSEGGQHGFLEATTEQARVVLDADEGTPTYDAGIAFMSLAMNAAAKNPEGENLAEVPTAVYMIWGALTDEMDAPGRGSPEQEAAAVRHMKQAACEWLSVVQSPEGRTAYLDHWVYEECGYKRQSSDGA